MIKKKNKTSNKFDLEYFEDSTNFPQQSFLQHVFKYFKKNHHQNIFGLVEFLNLFKVQNDLLIENLSNPGKTFRNLKSLPVSEIELHILYFFILEFYGGYPLKEYQYYEYAESDLSVANEKFASNYNTLLKLIETEFLSYPEDTAEKKTYLVKADDGKFIKQQTKTKKKQDTPKTFEELFYDTYFVYPCIDILKKIDPPLIDANCNYIGKLKGGICIWIDELQRQSIIKHISERKIYPALLSQKIKNFSIDESMFGKIQYKAEDKYRTDIKTLISQIKLSQDSQKGK
jgi:hypothetical protein